MYRTGEIYDDIKKTIIDIYIDYGIAGFPVDETCVCRKMGVALIPYTSYGKEDGKLLLKKSQHGFYVPGTADNSPTIFYNDLYESKGAQRLTVFHELKHLAYYDDSHKQAVSIDFAHEHQGVQPHRHVYLNHDKNSPGVPPTASEEALIKKIKKEFHLR